MYFARTWRPPRRRRTRPEARRTARRGLRARAGGRGVTAVEVAVAIAIIGSLLAVGVPAFVRELHASRFHEPSAGLARLSAAAVEYAGGRSVDAAFPGPAPLTPATVPRGKLEVDPALAWDAPTWRALHFRAEAEGVPHAFSFGFESALSATGSSFVAHAHGDLDGDGTTSTFEVRGHSTEPGEVRLEPGMFVASELE